MQKTILSSIVALLCSVGLSAQTNFSGTWVFKSQESISGKLHSNGSPKLIKATQTPSGITIEKTTASADGKDVTSSEAITFEGKPAEVITASKRKKVMSAKWDDDKKSFTEIAEIYNQTDVKHLDHKVTDTWSLEDDALVLNRKDENFTNGEVWESKASYGKQ